jgi:hypothetical protein
MSNIGSRCKVMHGNANKTSGGLTKEDLMYNKQGKIVSIKMSNNAKKEKRLAKAGWTVHKGQFGAIPMHGGVGNNSPMGSSIGSPIRSSPGSPNIKNTSGKYAPPPIEGSIKNKLINEKNIAINEAIKMGYKLYDKNLKNNRTYANPANAIFIDKKAKKVYKIGLWSTSSINDRSIENECKAYDKLMKKYPEDINIHYPQKYKCHKICDTRFGILELEYIPNIDMIEEINNVMGNNINEYLRGADIIHNDLLQNVFKHTNYSNETPNFLIMDFEDVDFIKNTSDRMNTNNNNNKNNNNNSNKNNNSNNNSNSNINSNNNRNNNKKRIKINNYKGFRVLGSNKGLGLFDSNSNNNI